MNRIALFFIIICGYLKGYGQFSDDFSDGNFSANPAWSGQTDRFVVASGELQLNGPEQTDESYLVTTSAGLDDGTWEFTVRMDFGTSGSNYSRVYLMSSSEDLTSSLNGYYVLIGETEDEVSLFRQDGSVGTVIIDGTDKSIDQSTVLVRVKVTRDGNGGWELFHDITGGTNYVSEGTATDNTYTVTNFFGVRCTYSSTRHDKFFFDDFNVIGSVIFDEEPPAIVKS